MSSNSSSILRRGKYDPDRPHAREFPSNHSRLLPTHIYAQFKKLYEHMSIPSHQRTTECKRWIKSFRFDPRDPLKHHNQGKFHPSRGDSGGGLNTHRCGDDNRTDYRSGGGDNRNRGY